MYAILIQLYNKLEYLDKCEGVKDNIVIKKGLKLQSKMNEENIGRLSKDYESESLTKCQL